LWAKYGTIIYRAQGYAKELLQLAEEELEACEFYSRTRDAKGYFEWEPRTRPSSRERVRGNRAWAGRGSW
jgi:hypothetical protein